MDVSCDRLVTYKNLDFRDEWKREEKEEGETKLNGVDFGKKWTANCGPAVTSGRSADSPSQ